MSNSRKKSYKINVKCVLCNKTLSAFTSEIIFNMQMLKMLKRFLLKM